MYQNQVPSLPPLGNNRYENLFQINQTEDNGYYFYNLARTVRINPDDIDIKYYYFHRVNKSAPYTVLSHQLYGSINLWWLICIINNIDNPVEFLEPGSTIRVIKQQYLATVLSSIKQQLQ